MCQRFIFRWALAFGHLSTIVLFKKLPEIRLRPLIIGPKPLQLGLVVVQLALIVNRLALIATRLVLVIMRLALVAVQLTMLVEVFALVGWVL